jgi:hypothetical protein
MTALDDPGKRFRAYSTFYAPPKLVSRGGLSVYTGHSLNDCISAYITDVTFLMKGCDSKDEYEFNEDTLAQNDYQLRQQFHDGKLDTYMSTPIAIFDMWESKDRPVVILKPAIDFCKSMLTTGIEFMLAHDYETMEDCERALRSGMLFRRLNGDTDNEESLWCGMVMTGDLAGDKEGPSIPPLISAWDDDGPTLNFTLDGKTLDGELDLETLQSEHLPADTLEIIRIPPSRENLVW